MSATRQWTHEEQERINRRRCDPAWELATEEEMATMSDSEEIERKRELDAAEEPAD